MKSNIKSLIEGLSYALDIAEKKELSHSKHVAYISYMLAKELGLSYEMIEDIYYAALLHDIGASNTYVTEAHCIKGKEILLKLPLKKELSEFIYYHHEYYNGSGPFKIKGDNIPMPSQIISFADVFDKKFGNIKKFDYNCYENIKGWLDSVLEIFNPIIINTFKNMLEKEYVLLDYFNKDFDNIISKKIKIEGYYIVDEEIIDFAKALANIIDNRSNFTYRHSVGIAELVKKITREMKYDNEIINKMYIAALLHDIGKLMVDNDIIEKPGRLTLEERYEVNKHTYYTRWILEQIDGFEEITEYASNHHEKLNGKGYPLQLKGDEIGTLERIMSICDVYQALTEERPYRDNISVDKVWEIIYNMGNNNELDIDLIIRIEKIINIKCQD